MDNENTQMTGRFDWSVELENLADEIDEKAESYTNEDAAIGLNHAADYLRDRAAQYRGFALARLRQERREINNA